jgi:hypothetical protein
MVANIDDQRTNSGNGRQTVTGNETRKEKRRMTMGDHERAAITIRRVRGKNGVACHET